MPNWRQAFSNDHSLFLLCLLFPLFPGVFLFHFVTGPSTFLSSCLYFYYLPLEEIPAITITAENVGTSRPFFLRKRKWMDEEHARFGLFDAILFRVLFATVVL